MQRLKVIRKVTLNVPTNAHKFQKSIFFHVTFLHHVAACYLSSTESLFDEGGYLALSADLCVSAQLHESQVGFPSCGIILKGHHCCIIVIDIILYGGNDSWWMAISTHALYTPTFGLTPYQHGIIPEGYGNTPTWTVCRGCASWLGMSTRASRRPVTG